MNASLGGYVYPSERAAGIAKYKLSGIGDNYQGMTGGVISVIPFKVPQESEGWYDFMKEIQQSEESLKEAVKVNA